MSGRVIIILNVQRFFFFLKKTSLKWLYFSFISRLSEIIVCCFRSKYKTRKNADFPEKSSRVQTMFFDPASLNVFVVQLER